MQRKKRQQKSSITRVIIIILFFLLGVSIYIWIWWTNGTKAIDSQSDLSQKIIISKGMGTSAIANLLKQDNLIRSPLVFRILVRLHKLDNQLQAGSYTLKKNQSALEIAQTLTSGKEEDFWVTIPEGKRREEIAEIINHVSQKYNTSFSIVAFLDLTQKSEGQLFPDTYLFPKSFDTQDIVSTLTRTFSQKIDQNLRAKLTSKTGLTFDQVLILASLIEREAKFSQDRPKIARVMLNRLDIGMPLQVDATIQYAMGTNLCSRKLNCNWWPKVTDTKYQSDYNTYLNPGLPPTPISNPGLAVFEAILNADDHDYLYYVSEDDGTTHYASTLEEHNANIHKYLR